jgi:hypothetical protein
MVKVVFNALAAGMQHLHVRAGNHQASLFESALSMITRAEKLQEAVSFLYATGHWHMCGGDGTHCICHVQGRRMMPLAPC